MQISSFAKSELCTATSIQVVEQWTSIQMLWRESGEMPRINRAVNGVNACWQEAAWVIYCVQILCKPILSNNCFRKKKKKKGMELMWPVCVKCSLPPVQNRNVWKGFTSTRCIKRIIVLVFFNCAEFTCLHTNKYFTHCKYFYVKDLRYFCELQLLKHMLQGLYWHVSWISALHCWVVKAWVSYWVH